MNYDYSALNSKVTKNDIDDFRKKYVKPSKYSQIINIFAIIITVAIGFQMLNAILATATDTTTAVIFVIVFFSFFAFIFLLVAVYNHSMYKERVRLKRFADKNRLCYEQEKELDGNYIGVIFGEGHSKHIYNSLIKDGDNGFEIANYQYCTGSGKSTRVHVFGFVEIELGRNLPHMVLDSIENNTNIFGASFSNLPVGFKSDQKLSLEGDFDKHFTLYAPKEYERDALYVFTPDLMALFIDEANSFDAEIIDNKLYIYSSKKLNLLDETVLRRIFDIVNTVGAKTISQTDHYLDERTIGRVGDVVSKDGRRLKKGLTVGAIISIVAVVLYSIIWLTNILNGR